MADTFQFQKYYFLFVPWAFTARVFGQACRIIALLVQFTPSSVREAETMTYRIKTWLMSQICSFRFFFLKLCYLHISCDLLLLVFPLLKNVFSSSYIYLRTIWKNAVKPPAK